MKRFQKKRKVTIKSVKRRFFQLLEIMVAVFILLICAAPAMRIYTNTLIQEQNIVRENRRDHLIPRIHAFLTEQLHKKTISFQQISNDAEVPIRDSELEAALAKISYEGSYRFSKMKRQKKQGAPKPDRYLVKLTIILKDLSVRQKKPEAKSEVDPGKSAENEYDYLIYIDAAEENDLINQADDDDGSLYVIPEGEENEECA